MCDLELDKAAFGQEWGIDFDAHFDCAAEMAADGLVALDGDLMRVTDTGRLFLRNIAMLFDAYYRKSASSGEALRYSKTF